jgi:2-desacetyl-2-hydroxyethyl bacteriochlorophyllide A dehydrogenase
MKAAVWNGPYDLSIQDVEVPSPGRGEVLIETKAVGICGSDLEIYDGRFKQSVPPLILGHEGAGIVHTVGDGVSMVHKGDRVSVECVLSCGRCQFCKKGLFGLCENGGVLGMTGANGEYAEFFVAPEKNCHILPDEISWSEAGLVDTLAGPVYAVAKLNFPLESSVAVFGPGPAGLFFCALSKLRGAEKVFLVGTREYRLKHGPEYGAERMLNVHEEDAVESIKAETEGKGVDIVIEAAGSEKALNGSLSVLKKGGVMLLYGVLGGGPISVNVQPIQLLEYTVLGSATVEYPPAIKLIRTGKIKVQNLVSHRFTLDQLPKAFSSGLIEKRHENYMKGVVLF